MGQPPGEDSERPLPGIREVHSPSRQGSFQGESVRVRAQPGSQEAPAAEHVAAVEAGGLPGASSPVHVEEDEDDVTSRRSSEGSSDDDGVSVSEDECLGEASESDIDYVQGDIIEEGTRVYSALNVLNGQLLAVKLYELTEDDDEEAVAYNLEQLIQLEH